MLCWCATIPVSVTAIGLCVPPSSAPGITSRWDALLHLG
jgi:hypothetical protein